MSTNGNKAINKVFTVSNSHLHAFMYVRQAIKVITGYECELLDITVSNDRVDSIGHFEGSINRTLLRQIDLSGKVMILPSQETLYVELHHFTLKKEKTGTCFAPWKLKDTAIIGVTCVTKTSVSSSLNGYYSIQCRKHGLYVERCENHQQRSRRTHKRIALSSVRTFRH